MLTALERGEDERVERLHVAFGAETARRKCIPRTLHVRRQRHGVTLAVRLPRVAN